MSECSFGIYSTSHFDISWLWDLQLLHYTTFFCYSSLTAENSCLKYNLKNQHAHIIKFVCFCFWLVENSIFRSCTSHLSTNSSTYRKAWFAHKYLHLYFTCAEYSRFKFADGSLINVDSLHFTQSLCMSSMFHVLYCKTNVLDEFPIITK